MIDIDTGEVVIKYTSSKNTNGVSYNPELENAIEQAHEEGRRIIAIHNHPNGLPPTLDDGSSAYYHGYDKGIVVGHNLEVWEYSKTNQVYTIEECVSVHNQLSKELQFSFEFDEELWYNTLRNSGMEVKRR